MTIDYLPEWLLRQEGNAFRGVFVRELNTYLHKETPGSNETIKTPNGLDDGLDLVWIQHFRSTRFENRTSPQVEVSKFYEIFSSITNNVLPFYSKIQKKSKIYAQKIK